MATRKLPDSKNAKVSRGSTSVYEDKYKSNSLKEGFLIAGLTEKVQIPKHNLSAKILEIMNGHYLMQNHFRS